jgi:tetratricopeptide (TPR) repeat protein
MDRFREQMQEEDDFRQVLERYEDMVERKSSYFFDVEEFELIIDYYLDIRNFKKANEAVEIATKQHPGSGEIIIKHIQIFLETNQPSQAIDKLKEIPEWDMENAEIYLLRGTALAQLGKIPEAEKQFDIALARTEEDKVEILINISMAFENARKFNLAIKYLRIAFAIEPENLTILYDLGFYYERMHEYATSIEFYNKYLDEDPFSDNVWYNLGVVYYKINQPKKALEAYDYAISVNPTYASAYFNKANIYANDSDFVNAIAVYHDFLSLEEDHVQGWCYLGECYDQIEAYDLALKTYKKVIEIDNTFPEGWFGAGLAYLALGNNSDAVTYLLKAIELDNENSDYWFHLGEAYESTHTIPEAIKCYRQTVLLDAKDEQAWLNLAKIYYNEKNYAFSLEIISEAFETITDDAELFSLEAAAYFRLADWSSGFVSLRKAFKLNDKIAEEFFKIFPEGIRNLRIQNLLNNLL